MTENTVIHLRIAPFDPLTAEWWDESSKCVVVRGSIKNDPVDFALRLDIDKRTFLDRSENPKIDELIGSKAALISQTVWKFRSERADQDKARFLTLRPSA